MQYQLNLCLPAFNKVSIDTSIFLVLNEGVPSGSFCGVSNFLEVLNFNSR